MSLPRLPHRTSPMRLDSSEPTMIVDHLQLQDIGLFNVRSMMIVIDDDDD